MIRPNMLKILSLFCLSIILVSCENDPENMVVSKAQAKEKAKIQAPKVTLSIKKGEVKRGQGLFQALKGVSLENAKALAMINALRDEVEFSKLKVGDQLEATFEKVGEEEERLIKFSFSQNPAEAHMVTFNKETQKWDYSFVEKPTFWKSKIIEGKLGSGSTLQNDLMELGLDRQVIAEVINVLLCKVNFRFNARTGDNYKILLNERFFEDKVIGTKVLYTSYKGLRAGHHEAFFYEDEEKGSTYTAHYTEDGQALIRSGLRYPLSRLHIRSHYGYRIHPVTGRRALHRGVDLRGRNGKPVHAVAAGKVIASSYNKYGGNKVVIRHRDGSKSYYLHLNHRKVNRGDWVRSYQVIGGVGSTGRVTGPHLHFGFKSSKGRWMNPMNKRMIATPKLDGKRFKRLGEQIAQIKGLMQDIRLSKISNYVLASLPNRRPASYESGFLGLFAKKDAKKTEAGMIKEIYNTTL